MGNVLNATERHTLKLLILYVFYLCGVGETSTAIQTHGAGGCDVTPTWTWGSCIPPPDRRVASRSAHKFSTLTTDHKQPPAPAVPKPRGLSPEPGASMVNE